MESLIDDFTLPEPSKLYSLAPEGKGTILIECGTGYLSRLAYNHCVTNHTLISEILLPLIREKFTINETHDKIPSFWALNSIGRFAERWVTVIEELTQRNDIGFLTT